MRVHLFDFDGTITSRSTIAPFLLPFAVRRPHRAIMLVPWMIGYAVGRVSFARVFTLSCERLLSGVDQETQILVASRVAQRIARQALVHPEAITRLTQALAQGERVHIVTGGLAHVAQAWAQLEGFEVEVTGTELTEILISGAQAVNVRAAKVIAVERVRAKGAKAVLAYGNSSGDFEMLRASDESWWVARNGKISRYDDKTC